MFDNFFEEVVVPLLISTVVLVTAALAVLAVFIVVKANAAPAPTRISLDLGGRLFEYIENYSNARFTKQHYVLDGLCVSACTTILGEIPPERVCVTPYAKLGFHAAFTQGMLGDRVFSPEGTEILWRIYPDWVHEFLKRKGWEGPDHDQPTLIWMEARDLMNVYRACPTTP